MTTIEKPPALTPGSVQVERMTAGGGFLSYGWKLAAMGGDIHREMERRLKVAFPELAEKITTPGDHPGGPPAYQD